MPPKTEKRAPAPAPAKTARFEKPRLQRRGALPRVTTAFGGTFNP